MSLLHVSCSLFELITKINFVTPINGVNQLVSIGAWVEDALKDCPILQGIIRNNEIVNDMKARRQNRQFNPVVFSEASENELQHALEPFQQPAASMRNKQFISAFFKLGRSLWERKTAVDLVQNSQDIIEKIDTMMSFLELRHFEVTNKRQTDLLNSRIKWTLIEYRKMLSENNHLQFEAFLMTFEYELATKQYMLAVSFVQTIMKRLREGRTYAPKELNIWTGMVNKQVVFHSSLANPAVKATLDTL